MDLTTGEKIVVIALPVMLIGMVACLIIWRLKMYFVREEISGETVWSLQKEPRQVNGGLILCAACIFFGGRRISEAASLIDIIVDIIIIAQGVVLAWLSTLPQKVCVNGILTQQGFIEWPMIRKVKDCEKKNIVLIRLNRQTGNEISVYCREDEKEKLEAYIRRNIIEE